MKKPVIWTLSLCLFASVSANAQFGKLRDLAKKAKETTDVQRRVAGTGEATNIQRRGGGTREARNNISADLSGITGGETKPMTLTLSGGDLNGYSAVGNNCLNVSDVQIVSPNQMKLKVTANANASDGMCRVDLKDPQGRVFTAAELNVTHKPRPGENFQAEVVSLEKAFAPTWKIKFPEGKVVTLTRGKQTSGGGYEYKDSNGKWYTSMYMAGALMMQGAYGNECSYQASTNSRGEAVFMALSNACGVAMMNPMEGTSN